MPQDSVGELPPEMDKTTRNRRLMEYLISLGLFVEPVYTEGDEHIEYLRVTTFLPWSRG